MAFGRGLYGGSWGRVLTIFTWALANWRELDTWSLIHDIEEPWDLPAFRFYNLILYLLKENKGSDDLKILQETLIECDSMVHPFLEQVPKNKIPKTTVPKKKTVESEKAEDESKPERPAYTPSWWRGDAVNYKVAKSMMMTLPKQTGPQKG